MRIIDKVREFVEKNYEDSGYYVYQVTRSRIAFARKGGKFCDHWEDLAGQDADLRAYVEALFAAEGKAPAKHEGKASKAGPKAQGKAVKAGAWNVEGLVARSPRGREWHVVEAVKGGWRVMSRSGCEGTLTKAGIWKAA